jgi:hypothetical protein
MQNLGELVGSGIPEVDKVREATGIREWNDERLLNAAAALGFLQIATSGSGIRGGQIVAWLEEIAASATDQDQAGIQVVSLLPSRREELAEVADRGLTLTRAVTRSQAQRSVFPALEDIALSVDLRTTEIGGEIQFVPVILARARLDEPIVMSGNQVCFQIPDDVLELLAAELEEVRARRDSVISKIGASNVV